MDKDQWREWAEAKLDRASELGHGKSKAAMEYMNKHNIPYTEMKVSPDPVDIRVFPTESEFHYLDEVPSSLWVDKKKSWWQKFKSELTLRNLLHFALTFLLFTLWVWWTDLNALQYVVSVWVLSAAVGSYVNERKD